MLTRIPEVFYQDDASSKEAYGEEPTGVLAIDQLIQGKSNYWISNALHREKKQKKLILADWTARNWSMKKNAQVCEVLKELMKEGFSIYMQQSDQIKPLTLENLSCMESPFVRAGMIPAFPDDIIRATIKQHHFSRDEIQVLDDYWLQALLNDQAKMNQRTLSTYDYLSLDINDRKKIIDVIKHSEQPLMTIFDDVDVSSVYEEKKSNLVKLSDKVELFNMFLQADNKYKPARAAMFDSRRLINAMEEEDINSPTMLRAYSIAYRELRDVRIILESYKDAKRIEEFLLLLKTLAPNLEVLHLTTEGFIYSNMMISPECMPNLVEISLNNCKLGNNTAISLTNFEYINKIAFDGSQGLTVDSLQMFLNSHPYLEEIKLRGCEISGSNPLQLENLNYLKTLYINGLQGHSTIQESLLKSSPNLTKLILSANMPLHFPGLPPESLLHIKEIDLSNSEIELEDLQKLRNAAPNVEKLGLQYFGGLVNHITLGDDIMSLLGSFKHLKDVDFSYSKLTSHGLEKFLQSKPNLEMLNLSQIKSLDQDIRLDINSLSNLRKLDLFSHNLSLNAQEQLLLAAPNVKWLTLTSSKFRIAEIGLKHLKILYFMSGLYPGDLQIYALRAPNIELLLIRGCLIDYMVILPAMCLKNVKILRLHSCDTTLHGIGISNLLTAAPYIEALHIYRSKLARLDKIDFPPLVNLKKISLNESEVEYPDCISSSSFKKLLNKAPNLEEIELINCQHIKEEKIRKKYPHLQIKYQKTRNSSTATATPSTYTNPTYDDVLVNPVHDHKQQKTFTPSDPNKPFQFRGLNRSKNQGMIIEKFCQYLTLTNQYLYVIPKLQDGICKPLSYYFIEQREKCTALIELAARWDGKDITLTKDLVTHFNELLEYIFNYQIIPDRVTPTQFPGNNLGSYLKTLNEGCILVNPWHAIAITPPLSSNEPWMVYDPNYSNGAEEVNETELLNTIRTAIGLLVGVNTDLHLTPEIKDPDSFIEQGGLLALTRWANFNEMLTNIPSSWDFSKNALDGLLLRDTSGVPAWVRGIQSDHSLVADLTNNLLQQFRQKNPDHQQQLQRSMEAMSTYAKHDCITHIIQNSSDIASDINTSTSLSTDTLTSLIELIRTPVSSDWKRALQTWNKPKAATSTLMEYCQQCSQRSDVTKRLIQLSSTQEVTAMQVALQRYCQSVHRPVFYIHSVEDMACKADYVKRDGDHGTMQPGPGGPLYDFLQSSKQGDAPILIVNYESFHSSDIIRLNTLLDTDRKIDDVLLPTDALVIGLINIKKPDCYQGSDFYSRFNVAEQCPVSAQTLEQAMPLLPVIKNQANVKPSVINLFHSPGWQTRLLGHWVLNENTLTFQEGALAKALTSGSTIEIKNGLWDDPAFQHFWRQACLQGYIEQAGRKIVIPRDLQLIKSEGHDWEHLKVFAKPAALSPVSEQILNPHRLNEFLNRYACDQKTGVLHQEDGIIKSMSGQALPVYLTRTLNDDEWAMLLTECERYHVTLQVRSAPHVELPPVLSLSPPEPVPVQAAWQHQRAHTQIISSTDTDTTVAMLSAQKNDSQIIDISECKSSDLLLRIDGKYDKNSREFVFSQTVGAVLQGLSDKKNIILHGHFSAELADQLAPLLLERIKADHPPGELILVSDEALPFQYAPTYHHDVTGEMKLSCLGNEITDRLQPFITREPLCKLQARLDYWRMHPDAVSSEDHWDGMRDLTNPIPPLAAFNIATCEEEARAFTESRIQAVNERLVSAPYVFLSGLSGVGKSTFVTRELKQDRHGNDYLLHQGKDQIQAWAEDRRAGCKLLFLDEATLSPGEWSEFEGLFQHPPGILSGGKFYELSKDHKVIFAGNPLSYGDERKLASLFQRHGNALVFDPLPPAILYEKILKPVFADTFLEEEAPGLSKHFLDVYRFLAACSQTDVLITPRELEMMAQLTLSHCVRNRDANALDIARQYAYRLARNLVPESAQAEFDSQFKPKISLAATDRILKGDFLLTSSRLPIHQQLNELLDLRVMRKNAARKSRKYGGLGGIILEGEPGIGKSELVMHTLAANNYFKKEASYQPDEDEKIFYHMPVSWPLAQKEKLLRKAFDEGSLVVIDEINSSPMMEELLNALLMGKTPEGKRPAHPGFMIIGTQNPVTMAGRRAPSTALSRRLITACLPSYADTEMKEILLKKGLAGKTADTMISAFNEEVTHAQINHLTPAPCFRDLLSLADNHIKASEVKIPEESKTPVYFSKNQRDLLFQERPPVAEMFSEKKFLSEIKLSMKHAHSTYINHHKDKDAEEYNRGHKTGFFSIRRHGDTGLTYAEKFASKFDEAGSLQEAINILHELLSAEGVKYNTHSFSSYVMDEVVVLLKDKIIIRPDNDGHYSRDDWANAKNTLENMQDMNIKPLLD